MSRVKHRPLKEVAKEILKKYKEHEELMIRLLSKNEYLRQRDLKVLEIEIGMYENEIERASAESVSHGKWEYGENESGDDGYFCSKCGGHVKRNYAHESIDFIPQHYQYCPYCGKRDGRRMSDWKYIGYTKVHDDSRKHMIEMWIWKCNRCGYEVRRPQGNKNKPSQCPRCGK